MFWMAALAMVPMGLGLCNSALGDFEQGVAGGLLWGQPLFGFGLVIGLALAVVFGLFFGAEYADGAIRNKLVAGHSRAAVYLAALLSGLLAALALYVVYLLAWLPRLGWMVKNFPAPEPRALAMCLAGTALLIAGQCSLCVILSMLIQRRSLLAVVLILLMVALIFTAIQTQDAWETAVNGGMQMMIDEAGQQKWVFHEPGQTGALTAFFHDALPGCQAYRYMELDAAPRMLAYSAALTVVTTALGLALFRRKDIK